MNHLLPTIFASLLVAHLLTSCGKNPDYVPPAPKPYHVNSSVPVPEASEIPNISPALVGKFCFKNSMYLIYSHSLALARHPNEKIVTCTE
jgi:hypothetical protein